MTNSYFFQKQVFINVISESKFVQDKYDKLYIYIYKTDVLKSN